MQWKREGTECHLYRVGGKRHQLNRVRVPSVNSPETFEKFKHKLLRLTLGVYEDSCQSHELYDDCSAQCSSSSWTRVTLTRTLDSPLKGTRFLDIIDHGYPSRTRKKDLKKSTNIMVCSESEFYLFLWQLLKS